MVSARRSRGLLRPTTPAAAFSCARQCEATTSATDRARMRSKAKAGLKRASALRRHARSAQERVNAVMWYWQRKDSPNACARRLQRNVNLTLSVIRTGTAIPFNRAGAYFH